MYIIMVQYMKHAEPTDPTIRWRKGIADGRLKEEFDVTSDTALAARLGVGQPHFSRVKNGDSEPGPMFMATVLRAIAPLQLDFYDVFEVVPPPLGPDDEDAETPALAS